MATILYRLGRFAFTFRWAVAACWLVLLILAVLAAGATQEESVESFDIPGTESSEAMTLLDERFPGAAADGASGRVVFAAPEGESLTDPQRAEQLDSLLGDLGQLPGLVQVTDPFEVGAVSPEGDVAYAEVLS